MLDNTSSRETFSASPTLWRLQRRHHRSTSRHGTARIYRDRGPVMEATSRRCSPHSGGGGGGIQAE